MIRAAIFIPFRDRGTDPRRNANLARVLQHWSASGLPVRVVGDDRDGDEQFCRSAAYNLAARLPSLLDVDVLVYTESDVLVDQDQIDDGIDLAAERPGLVVPFTEYRALTEADSALVRDHAKDPADCDLIARVVGGRSIGAVNIVSRETLNAIGQWDEAFEGSWWDDSAMMRAFEIAAGPTRWVDGPAYHLHHLPGWKGNHLTAEDKAATARNKARNDRYQAATTPSEIRLLTAGH